MGIIYWLEEAGYERLRKRDWEFPIEAECPSLDCCYVPNGEKARRRDPVRRVSPLLWRGVTGPFYTTPTVGLSSSANSTENCHFSLFGPSVPKPSLHIAAPATGVLFGGENSNENGPRFPGLEQTRCNTSGTKWVRRVLEFFWKVTTPSSTGPLGQCATFGGWKKARSCPLLLSSARWLYLSDIRCGEGCWSGSLVSWPASVSSVLVWGCQSCQGEKPPRIYCWSEAGLDHIVSQKSQCISLQSCGGPWSPGVAAW